MFRRRKYSPTTAPAHKISQKKYQPLNIAINIVITPFFDYKSILLTENTNVNDLKKVLNYLKKVLILTEKVLWGIVI